MADEKKLKPFTIEDVSIRFRNFAGKGGTMNAEGDRNFCILLGLEQGAELEAQGWNVKHLKPREEGGDPQPYMKVKVKFGKYPPKIVIRTSRGQEQLGEDEVNILDWAEIVTADIIVEPYEWDVNGNQGVTAYCKTLYVTIFEDELELKYAQENPDAPESAQACVGEECFLPPWNMPRP